MVDHQALVTIHDRYTLDAVENPRLQRMKERLTPFVFKTVWRKGSDHAIPDALSRSPVADPTADDVELDTEPSACIRQVIRISAVTMNDVEQPAVDHLSDPVIENLKALAAEDEDYQKLLKAVTNGFPNQRTDAHPYVQQFWGIRNELTASDGLVLFECRLVIPAAGRRDVLQKLHASHQGVERTKRRARQSVYWPAINSDIANTVGACPACQQHQPSQSREPMMNDPPPSRVFEDVSVDLFSYAGKSYLVYVDRLSAGPSWIAGKRTRQRATSSGPSAETSPSWAYQFGSGRMEVPSSIPGNSASSWRDGASAFASHHLIFPRVTDMLRRP